MTWTSFAFERTSSWEAECTARHVHTLDELETFVEQLRAFGLACGKVYHAAGNIRSPTSGGGLAPPCCGLPRPALRTAHAL